jgi:hypothetical protein
MESADKIVIPRFVSYQTHVMENKYALDDVHFKRITIIHATGEDGLLYEKIIAVNELSDWIRIDNTETVIE